MQLNASWGMVLKRKEKKPQSKKSKMEKTHSGIVIVALLGNLAFPSPEFMVKTRALARVFAMNKGEVAMPN